MREDNKMRQRDLIPVMVEHPGQTAPWYADYLAVEPAAVYVILYQLERRGLIRRELEDGSNPHNSYSNKFIWKMAVEVI